MRRFPRRLGHAVWPVLLAMACSRPELRTKANQPDRHQVPFQENESAVDNARADAQPAARNETALAEAGLPFRDTQNLPAGTLLTVRLKKPVSADNAGTSESFAAVVDEPVLVEGSTMLSRGAEVEGRVESASTSELKRDRGYVRLTLDSIDLAGRQFPIQTASLFVRSKDETSQSAGRPTQLQVVRLEGGRRLTFRLTESVALASQPPLPSR